MVNRFAMHVASSLNFTVFVRPLSLKTDVIKKRNRASGTPSSNSRKNQTLPKIASYGTRPRSQSSAGAGSSLSMTRGNNPDISAQFAVYW
ncbi:hypothetical protein FA13DRAFT_1785992 [Coprinellus micaceus]|uniref:Uncharacterized protein n=1 Tax=Coprinellus micaceus TaxID=71717 RepID=A0A4Y7TWC1_COPMI|nr:hypothetical protein FA13DRAFT_1785992 [Coprinellus micaceus]